MKPCPNCETEMEKIEVLKAQTDAGTVSIGPQEPMFKCPDCKHEEPFYCEDQEDADAGEEAKSDRSTRPS